MDKRHLRHRLTRWGYFIGLQAAADGYPPASTITRIMMAPAPGKPSSKILVRDLPPDVWRMHFVIKALPEHLQEALLAHYALPPKETPSGVIMRTGRDLANLLGISHDAYRGRLKRAHRKLGQLLDLTQK